MFKNIQFIQVSMILAGALIFNVSNAEERATCAIVYDYGWDASTQWFSSPQKAYCKEADLEKVCDTHLPDQRITCTGSDDKGRDTYTPWYQSAIDFAANKDGAGVDLDSSARTYPVVAFTRGVVEIEKPVSGYWPFSHMGMHLQSGVNLHGVPSAYGETLVRPSSGFDQAKTMDAIIVSNYRRVVDVLGAMNPIPPSTDVWIESISISGKVSYEDVLPDCEAVDPLNLTDPQSASSNVAQSGILVVKASPNESGVSPTIIRNKIYQVKGNAIELGMFNEKEFIGEKEGDLRRQLGMVLKVTGVSPGSPAQVLENTICGAGYGGITVIGDNVEIAGNTILQVSKQWEDNSTRTAGSTMGISAGFVGSNNLSIHHNVIEGGDYGIGSDGSFPAFIPHSYVDVVAYYGDDETSPNIFRECYQDKTSILKNQCVLDIASKFAATEGNGNGFNWLVDIHDNLITDATAGITIFKGDGYRVHHNTINNTSNIADTVPSWGVTLDSAINSFVYANTIQWWHHSVVIRGEPGVVSEFGSAYNGIGIKPPSNGDPAWECIGNNISGSGPPVSKGAIGNGNSLSCSF